MHILDFHIINYRHYNTDYYFQSNDFKKKFKITSLKKFGTEYPIQSDIVKNKINYKEVVEKQYNTKRKNNTFNKSNPEDICYKKLLEIFNDVKRQYKSELYPFNCDFYIPEIDTYIEYQGFWTHGGHPFNENNIEDINKLNKWKKINTSFYKGAIVNWTKTDVKKRNIAKENKLNYFEFFNIKDFYKWIEIYKNY